MSPMTTTSSAASTDQDRKGPGRPRSARADEAIIEAVLVLLSDGVTAEALSIEAVAAKAGVGKATIYRRWVNKDALLIDAVASLKGPLPEIAGVSVRDDLLTLMRPIGPAKVNLRTASVLPCLVPELRRSPKLAEVYQKVIAPRRQLIQDVIERGMASGELRADLDVEVVIAMLVGPMVAQSVLNWNPDLDRDTLAERLLQSAWPALAASPLPA
jgi:AcrR family transcriptional regulator